MRLNLIHDLLAQIPYKCVELKAPELPPLSRSPGKDRPKVEVCWVPDVALDK